MSPPFIAHGSSNARRILYVAYLYPPVGGTGFAGAQRITKFLKYLPCAEAHVLTARTDTYPDFVVLDNTLPVPVNGEQIHRAGRLDPFRLLVTMKSVKSRLNGPGDAGTPTEGKQDRDSRYSWTCRTKDFTHNLFYLPDRVSPWIAPGALLGARIVRRHDVNLIFATGTPWSGLVVGCLISLLTRVPLIADFRDPWIGNRFNRSKGRLLDATERFLERIVVQKAATVIANTETLRSDFLDRYPDLDSCRFVTVPNGYDPADARIAALIGQPDIQSDIGMHGNNNRNHVTLTHAGFLYGGRDPLPLIAAIEKISSSPRCASRIVFRQIGAVDVGYSLAERYARQIQEGSVRIESPMPYEQCIRELAASDILVNLQPDTATQIPSKFYDYILLDRPILTIGNTSGALAELIRRHGFGELFNTRDVSGIADFLENMIALKRRNGSLRTTYPQKEQFNVATIAQRLSDILTARGL